MPGEARTRVATCAACQAPLLFIRTLAGKMMPCDAESVTVAMLVGETRPGQPVTVLVSEDGMVIRGTADPGGFSITGRVPHWATCTDAKRFRRLAEGAP